MASPHVLVVEDDACVRGLLHLLLEPKGYAVTEAATVEEALLAIGGSARVDLIILDLVLGPATRKSGLEMLRTLRTHAEMARLPVIILTGAAITEAEEDQIREDKAYVFYKPAKLSELQAYIARLVRPALAN